MEKQKIKCSSKKHSEIDAISYCQICKTYFCNKCQSLHSELFEIHQIFNLDKNNINDIFTGYCKVENHYDKLDFFCKTHNQLCCAACLCKLEEKGNGQHKDCNVCTIENIKNEKKNELKKNINYLEDLSNKFTQSINDLKILFEKINENKETLKLRIQKIFTKIRNILNDREDELLLEVDNQFNSVYFKEDIIRESEKLPNKIKTSLEKGKIIDNNWNENKLNSLINDCINIENNIKEINKINEIFSKCNSNQNIVINFSPEKDNEINEILEKIKIILKIFNDNKNIIEKNNFLSFK